MPCLIRAGDAAAPLGLGSPWDRCLSPCCLGEALASFLQHCSYFLTCTAHRCATAHGPIVLVL